MSSKSLVPRRGLVSLLCVLMLAACTTVPVASKAVRVNENTPDAAPNLWEDIQYKQGYRLIPETITATLAFAKGERGWWQDELYESLLAANVWNPSVNPDGWKKITEEGT